MVSDIVNGVNFIYAGDTIWGSVIIAATFLPVTFLLGVIAYVWIESSTSSSEIGCCTNPIDGQFISLGLMWKKMWKILLVALIGPVAIVLATPATYLYVVYVLCRRLKEPSYVSHGLERLFKEFNYKGGRYAQLADFLKLLEAVFEANIQAIVGENSQLAYRSY